MRGQPWTPAEDEAILRPGFTAAQMGEKLGRTTAAINNRRRLLGERGRPRGGIPYPRKAKWLLAKTCAVCGALLPRAAFLGANGWARSECKECMTAHVVTSNAARQAASLEAAANKSRRWTAEDEAVVFARTGKGWTHTAAEAAQLTGRTFLAVKGARQRHLSQDAKKNPSRPEG